MSALQRGLTLVEMLMALTVFSIIATSCMILMRISVDSDDQLRRSSQIVTEFQVARSLIKSDLAQLSRRQTRNEFGNLSASPMRGGAFNFGNFVTNDENEILLLALVSNGRRNPSNVFPQSSLQYIEYRLVEEQIVRRVWPFLDRLDDTPYTEQVLFEDVQNVTISFLDGARWVNQWQSNAASLAPRSMDLSFDHAEIGEITQLFFIQGEMM